MLVALESLPAGTIVYPDSDGEPMSDNSRQFRWIFLLAGNLAALYRLRQDVVVWGNQLWYPVEGDQKIRAAPDVYVVFGRPKGHRGSYRQWEEGDVPLTVVFEVLSPNNTYQEMIAKFIFYEEHGVEEYYIYDPENNSLQGYLRRGDILARVRKIDGHVSPRLGVCFDLSGEEMVVRYPDGRPFLTFEELKAEAEEAVRSARAAREEIAEVKQRAARLAELSRKALRQEATAEELLELERLQSMLLPPP